MSKDTHLCERTMNFSTLTLRVLKSSDFVAFDGQPAPKPPMSTQCLPAETPGAQGLAGFPRGPPSTLPSTQFFAPILEMPAIAAKIFEISENIWGYDIAYLTSFCNIFSVLHKGRILTDALLNEPTCINKRKSSRNAEEYTMPQNRKRKFQKGE